MVWFVCVVGEVTFAGRIRVEGLFLRGEGSRVREVDG